jgi:putative FmdB family regulatory protein
MDICSFLVQAIVGEADMPNYLYRCVDCGRKFEVFQSYADYGKQPVICPHCQSQNVQRKFNRVRVARGDHGRLETLADPSRLAAVDQDPRALGSMMRDMQRELGEDMGGEFDEVVDRLAKGQSPDDIEKDMPDLGGDVLG